jgi:hypothetical protein
VVEHSRVKHQFCDGNRVDGLPVVHTYPNRRLASDP